MPKVEIPELAKDLALLSAVLEEAPPLFVAMHSELIDVMVAQGNLIEGRAPTVEETMQYLTEKYLPNA